MQAVAARWSAVAFLLIATACGIRKPAPDSGSGGGAGSNASGGTSGAGGLGAGGTGCAAPEHRLVGLRCAPTGTLSDAGTKSCTTDADCAFDGGPPFTVVFCLHGMCSSDQCLGDEDCPAGTACGCSDQLRGLTVRLNSCMPSSCRTDADCGPMGLCSPASGGHCGSLSGYHCRKATDTCCTSADCPGRPDGGLIIGYTCDYAPEVDHWQCVGVMGCGG